MEVLGICLYVICVYFIQTGYCDHIYNVDISTGTGRQFDGIGAISGGGATSKLLVNYPQAQRAQVLDFLFKPQFGASLQILKVEIGGDAQSSDGTESSHMHESWDENYHRGYEWWLMKEAKKRNPDIKLYGLPWGFPGWLGGGAWWPYRYPNRTADYIVRWVLGAWHVHRLRIDYLGIWNEKPYNSMYIQVLRSILDSRGLGHVKIVAADLMGRNGWNIAKDMHSDSRLNKSVDIIGAHYTGSYSSKLAQHAGKALWSSEDFSTMNDETGGGCMARIINQNYVTGLMTSTIAWNLLVSYYNHIAYAGHGLMTAQQPWSGHYQVYSPIWTTAHTTQFTTPGWYYLRHGNGVGKLAEGGSYVTLFSPDRGQMTVVIETMCTSMANFCLLPSQKPETVHVQNVTLQLNGEMAKFTSLHLWYSHLGLNQSKSSYFQYHGTMPVIDGKLSFTAEVNSVYTLTSIDSGFKGSYPEPPTSSPFPSIYQDDFEDYAEFSEPYNFAPQVGVFEVRRSDPFHGQVMRQVILSPPIHWCPNLMLQPLALIASHNVVNVSVSVDVYAGAVNATDGVFLAAHVDKGSCATFMAKGVFLFLLFEQQAWQLSYDLARVQGIAYGRFHAVYNHWYNLKLHLQGSHIIATINQQTMFNATVTMKTENGFVALGCTRFGLADFDNFKFRI